MKILSFGSCNLDYVYSVEHFVKPGETLTSKELNCFLGGKGLNQSVAIARSGAEVYHAGCIGTDGDIIRNALAEAGADVSFLKTVDAPTGHAIIQVDESGENSIIIYGGANRHITKELADEVLSCFGQDTMLVLQNEISNTEYIIEAAYKKGMKIVFNPAPFDSSLKNIDLNMLDVLILNETEAYGFSGEADPEKICGYFGKRSGKLKLIITLGENGSVYYDCATNEKINQPAFSVAVKDTTAAGDTFVGYFVSSYAKNEGIRASLETATAAASSAISKEGASASIPTATEAAEALKMFKG